MASWADLSKESLVAARSALGERCYRSATSRAYYSAYAAVTQTLADKGLMFAGDREGPSHQRVREMIEMNIGQIKPRGLRRMRATDKRLMKSAMNLLYENRIDADYRPSRSVDEDAARNSVIAASRVSGLLGISI